MAKSSEVVGWYDFAWSGGSFEVCFRPAGSFFCPKFQAPARWSLEGDVVTVDWAKFGKYELKFDPATKSLEGHALPKVEGDDKNWRKASFKQALSPVEALLFGDGAGTEWDFAWSGGSFPVQFKADGYNHFKCDEFPAHAHWSLEGTKLKISWAQYGNYELTVDPETKTMAGASVGGDPEKDWRKATLVRNLVDQNTLEDCQHHH